MRSCRVTVRIKDGLVHKLLYILGSEKLTSPTTVNVELPGHQPFFLNSVESLVTLRLKIIKHIFT